MIQNRKNSEIQKKFRKREYNANQWVSLLPKICEKNQEGNLVTPFKRFFFFNTEKCVSFEIRFSKAISVYTRNFTDIFGNFGDAFAKRMFA